MLTGDGKLVSMATNGKIISVVPVELDPPTYFSSIQKEVVSLVTYNEGKELWKLGQKTT